MNEMRLEQNCKHELKKESLAARIISLHEYFKVYNVHCF
jgi:hypothetical protein